MFRRPKSKDTGVVFEDTEIPVRYKEEGGVLREDEGMVFIPTEGEPLMEDLRGSEEARRDAVAVARLEASIRQRREHMERLATAHENLSGDADMDASAARAELFYEALQVAREELDLRALEAGQARRMGETAYRKALERYEAAEKKLERTEDELGTYLRDRAREIAGSVG